MEEYYYATRGNYHVPAFGSWDWENDLPFTQCFETARQAAGLFRSSYSEDRDLYVAGDLYANDVVTPAMIVVPRRRAKSRQTHVKDGKKQQNWVASDVKEPPTPKARRPAKPVDEDLYKIPAELLYSPKPRKKRGRSFFSSCCLTPACVA